MPESSTEKAQKVARVAEAHLRLLRNTDFQKHLEWLAEEYLDQRDSNDVLTGQFRDMGQGEAVRLRKIFEAVDSSGAILARVRASESQRVRGLNR